MSDSESMLSDFTLSDGVPGKCSSQTVRSEKRKPNENRKEPTIKVIRQVTKGIKSFTSMIKYSQDTLWIGDDKFDVMKHVKLTGDNIQVISKIGIPVYDIAVTSDNNLLLSLLGETKLRLFNVNTGQGSDCRYNVASMWTWGIHVTKDQKVIIGAASTPFVHECRKVVIVMDEQGNRLTQYEHDNKNKPLFTLPHRITSTSNGNIWVVDHVELYGNGRVVMLQQTRSNVQIYDGHPDINSANKPFDPQDILTSPEDNIIVTDRNNHTLHILDHDGVIITYIKTDDVGIREPSSLTLSEPGYFYIGCEFYMKAANYEHVNAKLYEVQYSGFEEIK